MKNYSKFKIIFVVLINFLILSCASTDKEVSNSNNLIYKQEENIDSLKARINDLNNQIDIMKEEIASFRAALSHGSITFKEEKEVEEIDLVDKAMVEKYLKAYSFYNRGLYAQSLMAFSEFIREYPKTFLTDNALFWLGDSYYAQKEYPLAINEYLKITTNFTNSSKYPDALLKLALSYKALNQDADYNKYINMLESNYIDSSAYLTWENKYKR